HVHVPWPNEHRRGSHAVSARSRRLGNGHENVSVSEWLGPSLNSTIGWHINRPRFSRERRLPPIQLKTLAAVNQQRQTPASDDNDGGFGPRPTKVQPFPSPQRQYTERQVPPARLR